MKQILPQHIYDAITLNVNLERLFEIRMRVGAFLVVCENSIFKKVLVPKQNSLDMEPLIVTEEDIKFVLLEACEHSLYSYTNQIKQGFITTQTGIRIGLCGEIVENGRGEVQTIKNISSLVIRIPHEIKNCSLTVQSLMFNLNSNSIENTLIIAPPGAGKTTFLRDISRGISKSLPNLNVLICDERGEIASVCNGKPRLDVGNADVLSYASKEYVFREGVRALRPDVLICDEIASDADCFACEKLASSGVKLIASVHAKNQFDLFNKPAFNTLLSKRIFTRYVVLSNRNGAGTYEAVLDENLKVIY